MDSKTVSKPNLPQKQLHDTLVTTQFILIFCLLRVSLVEQRAPSSGFK